MVEILSLHAFHMTLDNLDRILSTGIVELFSAPEIFEQLLYFFLKKEAEAGEEDFIFLIHLSYSSKC